jgi:hypothetical protein
MDENLGVTKIIWNDKIKNSGMTTKTTTRPNFLDHDNTTETQIFFFFLDHDNTTEKQIFFFDKRMTKETLGMTTLVHERNTGRAKKSEMKIIEEMTEGGGRHIPGRSKKMEQNNNQKDRDNRRGWEKN